MTTVYHRLAAKIEAMIDSLSDARVFVAFLIIPVIVFWRPHFFFIADDWSALIQMVENPFWQYVNAPDAEQWFPVFHLIFYGLIKLAGERYSLLVLANCLLTGVNAFLIFQFFQANLRRGLSLILSLVYAWAAVHAVTVWHAYNLCYILSFGFFQGALLLTTRYLGRPSPLTLGGIGLCSLLALLSHSFAIMAVMAVPLYSLLVGEAGGRRRFWPLAAVIAAVYLSFGLGYFTFAGATAATSHNRQLFAGLPGLSYYLYLLVGGVLAPSYHLFNLNLYPFKTLVTHLLGADFQFTTQLIPGFLFFGVALGLIGFKGNPREKRLCLWILAANLLPFLLVSLARHQIALSQAATARYGVFTLMGALLLAGVAWQVFLRSLSGHPRAALLSLPLLALILFGQFSSLVSRQKIYQERGALTLAGYRQLPPGKDLSPVEARKRFIPEDHPFITLGQALAIREFLEKAPGSN